MIDYLIHLWVNFLILLSCCAWASGGFWVLIWIAEKICRLVYQDEPRALYTSNDTEPDPRKLCIDCGGLYMLDGAGRCDLCGPIERASVAYYGFATRPGSAWDDPIYQSGSRAHDYDPLDFEDHNLFDHEDLVDGLGNVIKRICSAMRRRVGSGALNVARGGRVLHLLPATPRGATDSCAPCARFAPTSCIVPHTTRTWLRPR
jgi:hypothetical protein